MGFNDLLDKSINVLSSQFTPVVWVAVIAALFGYSIKELLSYNKNNNSNKSKVHDRLDANTFTNTVVPLLSDFNQQLYIEVIQNMDFDDDERPEALIERYERDKSDHAKTADLSSVESSIKLTDILDRMSDDRSKRKAYDGHYKKARICLCIGGVILGLHLAIGGLLIFSNNIIEAVVLSRVIFCIWLIFITLDVTLIIYYIIAKTKMDRFIDED